MLRFLKELFAPKLTWNTFLIRLLRPEEALPCYYKGYCPYEYDQNPERDIEGMPFAEGDWRSCPVYAHVCPEFMEEFNLTVDELHIRATLHCGAVLIGLIREGRTKQVTDAHRGLLQRYDETLVRYPPDRFPHLYD